MSKRRSQPRQGAEDDGQSEGGGQEGLGGKQGQERLIDRTEREACIGIWIHRVTGLRKLHGPAGLDQGKARSIPASVRVCWAFSLHTPVTDLCVCPPDLCRPSLGILAFRSSHDPPFSVSLISLSLSIFTSSANLYHVCERPAYIANILPSSQPAVKSG